VVLVTYPVRKRDSEQSQEDASGGMVCLLETTLRSV
jgi:hypothetical protein